MGWGKEWPKADNDSTFTIPHTFEYSASQNFPPIKFDGMVAVDLDKDGNITAEGKQAIIDDMKKVYLNKVPTHDPYTNPDATIYYECGCGAILDPNTKSFAALNNHASDKGWKIRFSEKGYTPYCVKCGEGVE